MELAIACLRKSNELSDHESRTLLLPKDYFRLVKYLESAGLDKEAAAEKDKILKRHPEFLDKRITNLKQIKEILSKNKRYKNDLFLLHTNSTCSICSKYDKTIFSISGKSKKYPKIPKEIISNGGFAQIVLWF